MVAFASLSSKRDVTRECEAGVITSEFAEAVTVTSEAAEAAFGIKVSGSSRRSDSVQLDITIHRRSLNSAVGKGVE